MASKKKRVEEHMDTEVQIEDDSDSEDEMLDADDEDEEFQQDVQVEFEARMLDDGDFHGIKTLLQQVFLKANINLSDLTNNLISQNHIGSTIKQCDTPEDDEDDLDEDDDAVFGLISVINITEKKNQESVKQIGSMLIDKCKECCKKQLAGLTSALDGESGQTGLLFSERYLNIPPQISVPMFESLWKEMEKCNKKGMKYDFGQFIMISKTYKMKGEGKMEDQMFFTNSEEELIHEVSDLSFSYSVQHERDSLVDGKWDADDQMEAFRTVMVISADKMSKVIGKIKEELSSN